MTIEERIRKIRLLILDVDGVLTGGRIIYDNYGDTVKIFDVRDGLGIVLLGRVNIKAAIISAGRSKAVTRRAKELKVTTVYQGVPDKLKVYNKLIRKFRLKDDEVSYIGDDLTDIPVMKRVGFAIGVPNSVDEVKGIAHYITSHNGGRGAVREIAELIIRTQGKWDEVMAKYTV